MESHFPDQLFVRQDKTTVLIHAFIISLITLIVVHIIEQLNTYYHRRPHINTSIQPRHVTQVFIDFTILDPALGDDGEVPLGNRWDHPELQRALARAEEPVSHYGCHVPIRGSIRWAKRAKARFGLLDNTPDNRGVLRQWFHREMMAESTRHAQLPLLIGYAIEFALIPSDAEIALADLDRSEDLEARRDRVKGPPVGWIMSFIRWLLPRRA